MLSRSGTAFNCVPNRYLVFILQRGLNGNMTRIVPAILAFCLVVPLALTQGSACKSSPRVVGAFGAMDLPVPPVTLSPEVLALLHNVQSVRRVEHTMLAPPGEQVMIYDSNDDELAPVPRVAIVADGIAAKIFDVSNFIEYGEQAIYSSSCEFEIAPAQNAIAITYTLSGDGTGSAFLMLTWTAGKYQIIFHRMVGQGRMVLGFREVELWERSLGPNASRPESINFECEWCAHRYLVTKFVWRGGRFVKTVSRRTRKAYDPAEITGIPLWLN